MANLGNVSVLNINGNELSIKDSNLTSVVNEIIEAIAQNNEDIGEHINDLNDKSFDNLIKITSNNESEISNIQDGLYKLRYITTSGTEPNITETLNNSAILIQKGTNQYLIKDGQLLSRIKTNNTWGTWASTIPDDSNLVHKTGDEIIVGNKTFNANATFTGSVIVTNNSGISVVGNEVGDILNISSDGEIKYGTVGILGQNLTDFSWIKTLDSFTVQDGPNDKTLQQALNERNNVQSDWNEGSTASAAYIKNKPTIPTVPTTSTTVTENDTNPVSGGAVYSKFEELIGAAPTTLDTLGEIAIALNNDADLAGTLSNQISAKIPKVTNATAGNYAALAADGTLVDSGHNHNDYVTSVNGQTGAVTVNVPVTSVDGKTGAVTISHPVTSVNGATGDVTVNVPVTSVNGKTGAVTINIPVTSVDGKTGAVVISHPVTSVNGATGDVELELSSNYTMATAINDDLYLSSGNTYEEAFGKIEKRIDDNEYVISSALNDLNDQINNISYPVNSVNGQTGDVTVNVPVTSVDGQTGAVTIVHPVTSVDGQTGAVTITHPVTSVNGATGDVELELSSNYVMATAINDDLELGAGDTYEEAFGKLEKAIIDNELIVSSAINDLNNQINDISYPVTSVNGSTGNVILELSSGYAMATAVGSNLELDSGDTYEEAFSKLEKRSSDISNHTQSVKKITITGRQAEQNETAIDEWGYIYDTWSERFTEQELIDVFNEYDEVEFYINNADQFFSSNGERYVSVLDIKFYVDNVIPYIILVKADNMIMLSNNDDLFYYKLECINDQWEITAYSRGWNPININYGTSSTDFMNPSNNKTATITGDCKDTNDNKVNNCASISIGSLSSAQGIAFNTIAVDGVTLPVTWNGNTIATQNYVDVHTKIPIVNHGTSDTTYTISPNIYHLWGTVTALNISLGSGTAGYLSEYMFEFTSGATATSLNLPASVKWPAQPTIATNKRYQVSIINDIGLIVGVDAV